MKNLYKQKLCLTLAVIAFFGTSLQAQYSGGDGSAGDPYQISTPADLVALSNTSGDWASSFVLTSDVDMSGQSFVSIGTVGSAFSGSFNGDGYVISNLTVSDADGSELANGVAFFGNTNGAVVENLGFKDITVISATTADERVAAIVGFAESTTVQNCYVDGGTIQGRYRVASIVGWNRNTSTVSNCWSNADITYGSMVWHHAGGIVGTNDGAVNTCAFYGSITDDFASNNLGGIVGNTNNGTEANCYYINTIDERGLGSSDDTTPLSVAQLLDPNNYTGFDFNSIWEMGPAGAVLQTFTVSWNGSAWSNGTGPSASSSLAAIEGPLTITDDVVVNNLIVNSGGSLRINSGASLAVLGAADGTVTAERSTTGNLGYSIVGSPVTGVNLVGIEADFLFSWNGTAWVVPTGNMMPGIGYFAGYTQPSPGLALTGPILSGNQSVAVTAGEFTILSNPYTAAISADDLIASDIAGTTTGSFYFWDDGGSNSNGDRVGSYIVSNAMNTGINIGSMQGFFVEGAAGGTLEFTPDLQVTTAGANSDQNFYRKTAELAIVGLSVSNGQFSHQTTVGFVDGATLGRDYSLDASFLKGNDYMSFYSFQEGDKFATQGLPAFTGEEIKVELGMDLAQAGDYTLKVDRLTGFGNDIFVTLFDRETGRYHSLNQGVEIPFNSSVVFDDSRFSVILTNSQILSAADELGSAAIEIAGSTSELSISYRSDANEQITIHSISGQVLFNQSVSFINNKATITPNLQKDQVYFLRVNEESIKFMFK